MKNVQNTIFFLLRIFYINISEKTEDTDFMLQLLILLTASHSSYNQIQLWAKKSDLSEYDLIEEQCVELTLFKSDPMNSPNSKVDRFILGKFRLFQNYRLFKNYLICIFPKISTPIF